MMEATVKEVQLKTWCLRNVKQRNMDYTFHTVPSKSFQAWNRVKIEQAICLETNFLKTINHDQTNQKSQHI